MIKKIFLTILIICSMIVVGLSIALVLSNHQKIKLVNELEAYATKEFGKIKIFRINSKGLEFELDNFTNTELESLNLKNNNLTFKFYFNRRYFPTGFNKVVIDLKTDSLTLDLAKKEINSLTYNDFAKKLEKLISNVSNNNIDELNLIISSNMTLKNYSGESKTKQAKISIIKNVQNNYIVAVEFDNYNITSFFDLKSKEILGEYSAYQSDFEFINFNFGLPKVFNLDSEELIVGRFKYDLEKDDFSFITGDTPFNSDSTIKGAIFSLHGLSHGMISWEYFNKNRWKLSLSDSVVVQPIRGRLTNLVFSQDDEGFNYINFNGEVEFYHNAFRDILGFEQPKESALLKHHLIGKWDLDTNLWELNRLNSSNYSPLIKANYHGYDLLFNPKSFKLTGAGEKSDNISFSYELTFDNAELKNHMNNFVFYAGVLAGDCILKFDNDQLIPEFTGSVKFDTSDGSFDKYSYGAEKIEFLFGRNSDIQGAKMWEINSKKIQFKDEKENDLIFNDLTANVNLYSDLMSKSNIFYFNLNSPKTEFNNYILDTLSATGAVNLTSSNLINKAFFESKANAINDKNKTLYGTGISSKLEFERNSFTSKENDGILTVFASSLSKDVKNIGKLDLTSNDIKIDFKSQNNQNEIASYYIDGKSVMGELDSSYADMCLFKNIKFDIENGTKINAVAENLNIANGTKKMTAQNLSWSLNLANKISNLSIQDGEFINQNEIDFSMNFDWEKFLNNNEISYFDSNFKLNDYKLQNASGLINEKSKNNHGYQFVNDSGILSYQDYKFGELDLMINSKNSQVNFNYLDVIAPAQELKLKFQDDKVITFEAKNIKYSYLFDALNLPNDIINGNGAAIITLNKPNYSLQTLKLTSAKPCKIQLKSLRKFAIDNGSVDNQFAFMALDDFSSKYLFDFTLSNIGDDKFNLTLSSKGQPNKLLPFEYDQQTGKLINSNYSLFNLESTISVNYNAIDFLK